MKQRNLAISITSALALLILILDSQTAFQGISDGLTLCMQTLIPSLFPFFLFSNLLTGALSGQVLGFLAPLTAMINLPKGSESILAIGFLGGYPVGAQNVANLHQTGQLSDHQASRMIVICNNAGPAFLFGVLGSMFSGRYIPWLLWCIHIVSALLVGLILRGDSKQNQIRPAPRCITISDALERSVKVMALVCGWVMLMRMMIAFLNRWFLWILPTPLQVVICGILELSNGCTQLARIESEGLRFIVASGMLSFGGICVALQTSSVTTGISKNLYFPGKILHCSISMILSCIIQPLLLPDIHCNITLLIIIAGVLGIFSVFTLNYCKNNSRISALSGV